jgi:hypothetical protein
VLTGVSALATGAGGIPSTERNRLSGQWLATSWTETWLVVVSALVAFCAIGLYTRMAGLHTFSRMSAYDFAATPAIGSSLVTIAITDASSPTV